MEPGPNPDRLATIARVAMPVFAAFYGTSV
jgi:hypothetical protein